tara:strand:- start:36399 stop:37046 length:648 start_codon:yes stop_codon:yes gene_type:complete
MEKSIESIWKKGFLKEDALVAPKLNNLYNQRSLNAVDKLFRMGRNNLIFIVVGAIVVFGITIAMGIPYSGAGVFILLMITVYYGKKQGEHAQEINKGLNSHQYLVEVKVWMNKTIDGYTYLYRFIYPAFVILFTLGGWYSSLGKAFFEEMRNNTPELVTLFGVPALFWAVLLVISALFSVFARAIYMADLKTVYGGIFQKIDTLLDEMEELSTEK